MAEKGKLGGAEGGLSDLPGGVSDLPSEETSPKCTWSSIVNVNIDDNKRSIVIVQRDTISIAEKRANDLLISYDDPIRKHSRRPPRMSYWTQDDVREWMKDCSICDRQADVFAEKVATGNLLIKYNELNLHGDFGFTDKEVECFVNSRKTWLSKESERKDYAFSRVSDLGGTSKLGRQLNVSYNVTLNNPKECIILIVEGNRLGGDAKPFGDIPVNMNVPTEQVHSTKKSIIYQAIYSFMKQAARQIGIEGLKGIVRTIENEECSLERIDCSSIRFIVRFYSQEGLDKFRERCLNGELAEKLTPMLITDEIRKVAGQELKIHLTIEDTDYKEALRVLHPRVKQGQKRLGANTAPVSKGRKLQKTSSVRTSTEDPSSGTTSKKQDSSQAPLREEETKWAFGLRNLKKLQRLRLQKFSLNGDGLNKVAKSLMQLTEFVELDVSGNPLGGSTGDWLSSLRNTTKLEKIDFSECHLTGQDAKSIGLMIRDNFNIQLNLSGNDELGGSIGKWLKPVHQIKNLNHLDLSACKVHSSTVVHIIYLHSVEELNLSLNELGGSLSLWAPALKKLNDLTKLVLRSCALTAEDLKYINDNLEQNENFHELDISGNHGIGSSLGLTSLPKKLKKLDMSDCCLDGEALDQYVTAGASLIDINLSRNTNIVPSALSKVLRKLTKLEKLSLRGCSLTGEFMGDILGACLQLVVLDISDNEGLRGTLSLWLGKVKEMENLQRLSLGSCNLASTDVGQVVTNLKDAVNFRELILPGNRDIGGSDLTTTSVADMSNLNILDLSDCMLKGNDMFKILEHERKLVELILSKNDELGGTLNSWSLQHLKYLQKLDLGLCKLTPEDVDHLATEMQLHVIPSLIDLRVAGNTKLGESPNVWSIFERLTQLKKLDINDCSLNVNYKIEEGRHYFAGDWNLEELDMSSNENLGLALRS